MAIDPGHIDTTLAAAVGDDPGLIVDLHLAFLESADLALAAMAQARDEAGWIRAAQRLEGLAASFGAVRLMAYARAAATGPAFDAAMLDRLKRTIARL